MGICTWFSNCGTPWNGKERYGSNTCAQIKSLVFLERSLTNSITPLPNDILLSKLVNQILMPDSEKELTKTLELLDITLKNTKQYLLKCNMEPDAAICSYNEITK